MIRIIQSIVHKRENKTKNTFNNLIEIQNVTRRDNTALCGRKILLLLLLLMFFLLALLSYDSACHLRIVGEDGVAFAHHAQLQPTCAAHVLGPCEMRARRIVVARRAALFARYAHAANVVANELARDRPIVAIPLHLGEQYAHTANNAHKEQDAFCIHRRFLRIN